MDCLGWAFVIREVSSLAWNAKRKDVTPRLLSCRQGFRLLPWADGVAIVFK